MVKRFIKWATRYLSSWCYRLKHKFKQWGVSDLLNNLAWLVIAVHSAFTKHEVSLVVAAATVVMALTRIYPAVKNFRRGEDNAYKKKRRIRVATTLDAINRLIEDPAARTAEKLQELRKRILECIVEHVRDLRQDQQGTKIYSNLLIKCDGRIVVVARDAPTRQAGTTYETTDLKCGVVFDSLEAISCGDARSLTTRAIEYKSFMALPVVDHDQKTCLAVVTIDSTEMHHFDDIYQSLETMLRPYIRTLAITYTLERSVSN